MRNMDRERGLAASIGGGSGERFGSGLIKLGASVESISNSTDDAPAEANSKMDTQESDHRCNDPKYDDHCSVCLVVRLAQLRNVISPAGKYLLAPPNSKCKQNGLNKIPRAKKHTCA
jgi:hypothetical protein